MLSCLYEFRKRSIVSGFTSRYNVNKLVYFEEFEDISLAIARERRLKEWPRQWKINLINQKNPSWIDLYYLALR
ncbi:GIY-YIG nuclease family protein [Wolbachia endosymbiont of Nasonia oneida]|uniref:GIY-YIG nuclease family protein n=1 Tax=Wolbachia endosymbiont of Nasonia oneida TaxID=2175860 RepID=UPI00397DFC98